MELLFVHDTRQAKVCNQQISVVFGRAEQQILGLQIAVYNAVVVKIRDSGQRRSYEVCCVRLVVVALSADAVEQLASKRKVGYKVY